MTGDGRNTNFKLMILLMKIQLIWAHRYTQYWEADKRNTLKFKASLISPEAPGSTVRVCAALTPKTNYLGRHSAFLELYPSLILISLQGGQLAAATQHWHPAPNGEAQQPKWSMKIKLDHILYPHVVPPHTSVPLTLNGVILGYSFVGSYNNHVD